jgi:hypothetical protein
VETRRVLFAVSDDSGCRKDSRFPQPRPARDLAGSSDETAALTHADWLGLLLDRELTHRRDKRLAARLRAC